VTDHGHFKHTLPDKRLEREFSDAKPLYSQAEALLEANRCLYCYDAPCIKACPAGIDIPSFIWKISGGNLIGSARTILTANILGLSTGRICPVEELCVGACVYNDLNHQPIQIGRIQRYVVQKALELERSDARQLFVPKESCGKKVALIGAGPASLACASYLVLEGVKSIVFEKSDLPGGLNTTGVAPYKLQAEEWLQEVTWLLNHGVELKTGVEAGKDIQLDSLLEEYDAVFIGVGLGSDQQLGIPGEEGASVWGATELIQKIKNEPDFLIPEDVRSVVVIGGGNTAIDIARELAMLGVKESKIVYRRTEEEMRGYKHELTGAREYGVRFHESFRPVEIVFDDNGVTALRAESTTSGQIREFPCDWVVVAIGQKEHASCLSTDIKMDENGRVVVDPLTRETSLPDVYAGGDCINGGKEVINAVEDGREAAFAMLSSWGLKTEPSPIIQQQKDISGGQ